MNIDEAWRAIDEHRLAVAALLEDLNDQEWTQASPCEGWTVRDVSAHLTLQQIGPAQALAQIVRNPGGMNRMIHDAACRRRSTHSGADRGHQGHGFPSTQRRCEPSRDTHRHPGARSGHRDSARPVTTDARRRRRAAASRM